MSNQENNQEQIQFPAQQELKHLRTRCGKVYALGNNRFRAVVQTTPVHEYDAATHQWVELSAEKRQQMAAQEQKLEELTLKIEDVETLLDDVSDAAYDKAVEVVTDTVRQETHKEDIRLVEESKKWVLSPERKAPKKEREYAAARLDGVINKIKNVMQTALAKIQRTLMQPEVKQAGKEQVKKKAKESIMDMLAKAKIDADRDNRERWEREGRIAPTKKQDMEL